MSEQHTPTTDEVRDAWAKRNALYRSTSLASLGYRAHVATNSDRYSAEDYAEFDHWLASHEATIRRDQIEKVQDELVRRDQFSERTLRILDEMRAQIGDTDEQ